MGTAVKSGHYYSDFTLWVLLLIIWLEEAVLVGVDSVRICSTEAVLL